jgi:hypothetical protein
MDLDARNGAPEIIRFAETLLLTLTQNLIAGSDAAASRHAASLDSG